MVRLICWCMFAVVGDRLCVKKIRSLKKVNNVFMRCEKAFFDRLILTPINFTLTPIISAGIRRRNRL